MAKQASKQASKQKFYVLWLVVKKKLSLNAGFTLVELSIVLVIIAFLAGGVIVGKDMIESASIRKVISTVDTYKSAVNTFKMKYNCLPGDCQNSTSLFTLSGTIPGSIYHIANDGTTYECYNNRTQSMCNGNGNGSIDNYFYQGRDENLRFWLQLQMAGLIGGGNYSGRRPGGFAQAVPNYNIPPTEFGAGIDIFKLNFVAGYWFPGNYGHVFEIASPSTTFMSDFPIGLNNPAFTTKQARALDSKIDDGMPYTGTLRSPHWMLWGAGCTVNNFVTSNYDTNNPTARGCALAFMNVF